MASELADLLAVQDLDLALDQIRHRRAHLPERAELTRWLADTAAVEAELAELGVERNSLAERQAGAEAELAGTETRIVTIDRRLYGGKVSAARDLQAMSAELDHLKARASTLEDLVLEVLEVAEPLDVRAGELRAALEDLAARRADTESRLAVAETDLDAERAEVEGRRAAAAAAIGEGLIRTYERLRARLGGVGVARLVGNHCDGCHLALSAVELDHLRHLPEGEVYACEQCGRILVP